MKRCLISAAVVAWLAAARCVGRWTNARTKGHPERQRGSRDGPGDRNRGEGFSERPGTTKTVPVNEIKMIAYDDEPTALTRPASISAKRTMRMRKRR